MAGGMCRRSVGVENSLQGVQADCSFWTGWLQFPNGGALPGPRASLHCGAPWSLRCEPVQQCVQRGGRTRAACRRVLSSWGRA